MRRRCPRCDGRGHQKGPILSPDTIHVGYPKCSLCNGTGLALWLSPVWDAENADDVAEAEAAVAEWTVASRVARPGGARPRLSGGFSSVERSADAEVDATVADGDVARVREIRRMLRIYENDDGAEIVPTLSMRDDDLRFVLDLAERGALTLADVNTPEGGDPEGYH